MQHLYKFYFEGFISVPKIGKSENEKLQHEKQYKGNEYDHEENSLTNDEKKILLMNNSKKLTRITLIELLNFI